MIAANVPSLRDYVTDGQDCLLYEPENAEELAEQMERLIKDPEFSRRLGENAMQSVREKWNEKGWRRTSGSFAGRLWNNYIRIK